MKARRDKLPRDTAAIKVHCITCTGYHSQVTIRYFSPVTFRYLSAVASLPFSISLQFVCGTFDYLVVFATVSLSNSYSSLVFRLFSSWFST